MSIRTVRYYMDDIVAWLNANDIPADLVPIEAVPVIDKIKGTISIRVRRLNERGNRYVNIDTNEVATWIVTVPLRVEPPTSLLPWVRGEVRAR